MDRAFKSGALTTPPTPPTTPLLGYATGGNPASGTPATTPGEWWYHMVTEELRKVIVDAGLTPDAKDLTQLSAAIAALTQSKTTAAGVFDKIDKASVAFSKTAAGTAVIKAGTRIGVNGGILYFPSDANIVMPTLTAGTDYAIYACADGTVRADASFSAATGYTAITSRRIGGFHYAPGACAAANAGGDSTPQINPYSFWDVKWRPNCTDPRGMALVADSFWADIYMLGVDHLVNGTSKLNVTIADGASPPKIPTKFGGNGATSYASLNWWEASEVAKSYRKRLPAYDEFSALAFGSTENQSIGTDPISTSWQAAYVSKWGINQATGNLWTWGKDFSFRPDGTAGWNWYNSNGGRGQLYMQNSLGLVASLFGGGWSYAADSGSRASNWTSFPWDSGGNIGARLVCDHLITE
jgi:hypothetical protein